MFIDELPFSGFAAGCVPGALNVALRDELRATGLAGVSEGTGRLVGAALETATIRARGRSAGVRPLGEAAGFGTRRRGGLARG
jgi:hypothetical protein